MHKSASQRVIEKAYKMPVDALLRDLYVDKRHTDQEIGDALGVTRAAVQQWREQYGITREDREPVELPAA